MINKNKILDQFYTKKMVAERCYMELLETIKPHVNINKIQFLEPSAGTGTFFDLFPNKHIQKQKVKYKTALGFDIDPKHDKVEQMDFLSGTIDSARLLPRDCVVVVGNPPFGKRCKLAIDFFNKACEYASTVAFIIPLQFKKWSVHSKLNPGFKLIKEITLDPKSFIFNGKGYKVNCMFQIWTTLPEWADNLRIMYKPPTEHVDFAMWQYNNTIQARKYFDKAVYNWDFAVVRQGFYDYTQLVKNVELLNDKRQWIFFKADSEEILQRLQNIDFDKLSKNNTTIPGFGKADVIKEYNNLYY